MVEFPTGIALWCGPGILADPLLPFLYAILDPLSVGMQPAGENRRCQD
jgi:hypothetical protein